MPDPIGVLFLRSPKRWVLLLVLIALPLCLAGCSGRPQLGQVSGRVTMDGEPLGEIEVKFMPDPAEGNSGRYSVGTTDANGYYTLTYFDESRKPGVSTGVNRIVLRDLISAYSGRDEVPIPSRIDLKYGRASTTPLSCTVQGGSQEVPIEIEP